VSTPAATLSRPRMTYGAFPSGRRSRSRRNCRPSWLAADHDVAVGGVSGGTPRGSRSRGESRCRHGAELANRSTYERSPAPSRSSSSRRLQRGPRFFETRRHTVRIGARFGRRRRLRQLDDPSGERPALPHDLVPVVRHGVLPRRARLRVPRARRRGRALLPRARRRAERRRQRVSCGVRSLGLRRVRGLRRHQGRGRSGRTDSGGAPRGAKLERSLSPIREPRSSTDASPASVAQPPTSLPSSSAPGVAVPPPTSPPSAAPAPSPPARRATSSALSSRRCLSPFRLTSASGEDA